MTAIFNTLEASEKLRKAGFDEDQSKELVRLLHGAISGSVTTQEQLDKVESSLNFRIEERNTKLNVRVDGLETNLNTRIDVLETRLNTRMGVIETRLNVPTKGVETRPNAPVVSTVKPSDPMVDRLKATLDRTRNQTILGVMAIQTVGYSILLAAIKYF